jgi:hypothetical protein
VGKTKTTIELNGKRYDAVTGALAGEQKHPKKAVPQHIDGIVRHPAAAVHKSKRQPASHAAHHTPQPAKTLMRSAVKKPALKQAGSRHGMNAAAPLSRHVGNLPVVMPKLSLTTLSHQREKHAAVVKQSSAIRRFAPITPTAFDPAVSTRPEAAHAAAPAQSQEPAEDSYNALIERALHHASSHTQKAPKRSTSVRKRVSAISLSVVAVVALGGFVATQNLTDIRLQMASSKAGFSAALPSYHPAGFHVGKLDYGPGSVAVRYDSNSDDRSYTITEKTSSWDSATLRDVFVSQAATNFETAQQGGRTVYVYGNNQATWVSAGVWYQVQTDGALSSRQLVDLAASL